ncbi:hypothetical protein [Natrinema salinisoli]|uniref:hypothetical protein n=1 Tax=Natrinema salinisoli TaxID=2878535 RepID=UPI001CF05D74|nr:hypothetical protein [Natrinema salinisoli]
MKDNDTKDGVDINSQPFNRRRILQGMLAATATSGLSMSTSAKSNRTDDHSSAVLASATPPQGGRKAVIRAAEGGAELAVIQNKNKETVLDVGDQTPLHPAWNRQGNRLVVSLDGDIWMYKPKGEFVQLTDSGRDVFPQFEKNDIVFFRGDDTKRISHEEMRGNSPQTLNSRTAEDTEFKLQYATEHPSTGDELADEISAWVASEGDR